MTRKDLTYRIIKVGKTAVSVAVMGFIVMGGGVALADDINVRLQPAITTNLTTPSISLFYDNGANATGVSNTNNFTINLDRGVNLSGQNITGLSNQGFAVYSRDNDNGPGIDKFSLVNTTLNLSGGNNITGLVGAQALWDGIKFNSFLIDPLKEININGSDVVFNRDVYSGAINLTTAVSVDFWGNVSGSALANQRPTTLDFKGNNAIVTLGAGVTLDGNIANTTPQATDKTSGSLILLGNTTVTGSVGAAGTPASGLSLIRVAGSGSTASFGRDVYVDHLDYANAVTVNINGSLIMNTDTATNAEHGVRFNSKDGVLNITGGDLTGVSTTPVVSNLGNNLGTVTFIGTGGTQTVTGQMGETARWLKTINIGDVNSTANYSSVTVNGNIFATTVALNNKADATAQSSSLTLGTGSNLTATNVTTDANGQGQLILAGGTQTVDAVVGADLQRLDLVRAGANGANSTFKDKVYANTVENSGTGSSTFKGTVDATNVNVNAGTSTFDAAVTTTNATIGTGTATFNGTTTANLAFTGTGTANLNQDLTGTVAFGGNQATVNLADTKTITGAISTTTTNTGILNVLGDGTLGSTVGATNLGIAQLNINTGNSQNTTNGLLAQGSIFAGQTTLQNNGTLTLNSDVNLTGTDNSKAALVTSVDNTGSLRLLGNSTITGPVGEASKFLRLIEAGAANALVTFKGATAATTTEVSGINAKIRFDSGLTTNVLDYKTNGTSVTVTGDLTLSSHNSTAGQVKFNGKASELNLVDGNLVGNAQTVSVSTSANGTGILNVQSTAPETQRTVTGHIGDANAALNELNVGFNSLDNSFKKTLLTVDGNIFAVNTNLDADSTLTLASGRNLTGVTVTTATNNTGTLRLAGGSQTIDAVVGTSTAKLKLVQAGEIASSSSTFKENVFASEVRVGAGSINLADGKALTGNITATNANTGSFNTLGAATINGDVGSSSVGLGQLNLNTAGVTSQTTVVNGSIFAGQTKLNNDGTLVLAAGKNLTGTDTNLTALVTSTPNTGSLVLQGTSTITGGIGEAGAALKLIKAEGTAATTVTLDGAVVAETVKIGDGKVQLKNTVTGLVDFQGKSGQLRLADNVNLSTSVTPFANANSASLYMEGNSTITGQLGSATEDRTNLKDVFAGVNGKIVTFKNDVHLASTTLHVVGTGVVNLEGNLYAPIVFDADGSVNVGSGKQVTGTVTTAANNTGTLNFVGDVTTLNTMGTSGASLKAVNFHSSTTGLPLKDGAATVNLGHSVYATNTTVGNATSPTTFNITGNVNLGTNVTLTDKVTLNTAGTFSTFGSSDGRLVSATVPTQSTFGAGTFNTNGATLNFAVGTLAWDSGPGLINELASSTITGTGTAPSTLAMSGTETVNVTLQGSLRNGQTISLIDVRSGGDIAVPDGVKLNDNSFVIDTILTRGSGNGDLVLTATRGNNAYITQSATQGHASNAAALRLGTLAAAGTGYTQDMQTVLNKLDINDWGYGNNQANLATQVKRLAPVANRSYTLAAQNANSASMDLIGDRLKDLRKVESTGDAQPKSVWLRNTMSSSRLGAANGVDGFKHRFAGFTLGADTRPSDRSMVGGALSYGSTRVTQSDAYLGDAGDVKTLQLTAYGAYDFNEKLYLDGMFSLAQHDLTGARTSVVGRVASQNRDASSSAFKLNLGYRIALPDSTMVLTPLLSHESSRLSEDAYTETGAGDISLAMNAQRYRKSQTGLGLRLNGTTQISGMVAKPEVALLRLRDSSANGVQAISGHFVGDANGTDFNTSLADVGKSSTRFQLGVGLLMSKTSTMSVRYQREQRSHYSSDMAELLLRWDF